MEDTRGEAPMGALALALPALLDAVPQLVRIFGSGSVVSERNAKAADIVVNAAKVATGSVNEQDLAEKIGSGDPTVLQQVRDAVESVWYEISLDTGGIQAAREASVSDPGFWKQPAFWITLLLLPLVYIVTLTVLGIMGNSDFTVEVKIMVVSSIISGLLGAISGFWLGTSWSSHRKTELQGK
jgi:hypothetical protein